MTLSEQIVQGLRILSEYPNLVVVPRTGGLFAGPKKDFYKVTGEDQDKLEVMGWVPQYSYELFWHEAEAEL